MDHFIAGRVQVTLKVAGRRTFAAVLLFVASSASLLLAGCAGMITDAGIPAATGAALQGNVHGGQQPVQFATIQLYAAKATGYSAASQALLTPAASTNANGDFNISGSYTCPASPNDQVYIVATGGNPGSGTNANLSLMAALGSCSLLSSSTHIVINEATTVAAVYALSGFMSDYQHVGTSSTNYKGLSNAFATAGNLVNIDTGAARATTPAYATMPTGANATTFASVVPQATINSLANIISTCVNSNGVGGSSNSCANLFATTRPSTLFTAPTDTIQALLYIAQFPGSNVSTLYGYSTAAPPFAPALATAPNDWTVSLTFTGGGLGGANLNSWSQSSGLAVDASGNIWVSNSNAATVTELSNLGAPISATTKITPLTFGGFPAPSLAVPSGLAVDLNGNIWVTDDGVNQIAELTNNGSAIGSGFSFGSGNDFSQGIAIDGLGHPWVVGKSSLIEFASTGSILGGPFTTLISSPTGAVAIDGSNNIWMENGGNGNVIELNNAGSLINASGNQLPAPTPFAALDSTNQLWAPQGTPGSGEYGYSFPNGVLSLITSKPASMANPVGVCVDGLNHVWTTAAGNSTNGIAPNIAETTSSGGILSPNATGFTGSSAGVLASPGACEPDTSGNLWVLASTNAGSKVVEFVGLAAPSVTPLALAVKNQAIGVRP